MLQLHLAKIAVAAGMGILACAGAASQPETQPSTASTYFFQTGSRSYLGIDIQDVTADRVAALKLKEERGVEVSMVDQDAPAGKAGIKQHDVILDFNGTLVESEEQLRRLIRETPPGRTVNLGISRDGNPLKISVQLGDRGKEAAPKVVIPRIPNVQVPKIDVPFYAMQLQTYSSSLGIQTENLNRQLGEYFGVKDGAGVLVRSVEKGSAGEKAGLKAGDVIVRADNERLSDRADLGHVLRSHREGGKLSLGIMRDRHEQTVTVELPQRGPGDSSWPNSDDLRFNWENYQEEFQKYMDEVRPELERVKEKTALKAYAAAEKVRAQLRDSKPEVERAMRQAQDQLRRMQRELQREDRQLRKQLHDMI